jgi:hypothetical protein
VIASAVRAQGWQWEATLYVLGAAMEGTTGVGGQTADVDLSFGDILEDLEFGAMGRARAARGAWSIGLDAIYMGLGGSSEQPPAAIDVDQTAIELSGGYRIGELLEPVAGVRYLDMGVEIVFQGPAGLQREPGVDWWDPFVGVNVRAPLGQAWSFRGRADIGGFGLGSELAWQLESLFDWRLSERTSIQAGYRAIDIDYEDDDRGFTYDILTQGPQAGVTFRF